MRLINTVLSNVIYVNKLTTRKSIINCKFYLNVFSSNVYETEFILYVIICTHYSLYVFILNCLTSIQSFHIIQFLIRRHLLFNPLGYANDNQFLSNCWVHFDNKHLYKYAKQMCATTKKTHIAAYAAYHFFSVILRHHHDP